MAAIDVMRRYLQTVQRGDWAAAFGFFADDIVLHAPGRSSLAGEHRGREAVEGYLRAALARAHGARVEVELVDILASEERVALVVRERFKLPGRAVEIRRANLYRLAGDRITEVWIFEADQYQVDELLGDPPAG
jgi:ketosteroid isomerase-like protein